LSGVWKRYRRRKEIAREKERIRILTEQEVAK